MLGFVCAVSPRDTNAKLWIELGRSMEYSWSLVGYCSEAQQIPPTPDLRLNRPDRLPLSNSFSPQGQLFTMRHHLSINNGIKSRRIPCKKSKTCWRQFGSM